MWFPYNPPADSQLVDSTITTRGLPCPGQELRLGASQGGSGFICSPAALPFTGFVQGREGTVPQAVETAGLGEQPGPGCHGLAWLHIPTAFQRGQWPPDGAAASQSSVSGGPQSKSPWWDLHSSGDMKGRRRMGGGGRAANEPLLVQTKCTGVFGPRPSGDLETARPCPEPSSHFPFL